MVSLIISTYNQPEWLQKVLWSCETQTFKAFEIIIADDGSSEETNNLITTFKKQSKLKIHHVWHEDQGFRKTVILNKAIKKSQYDYLIFTDGDCVLRADFIETHMTLRQPKLVLSGGYFKLNLQLSQNINHTDITSQICFDSAWLIAQGQPKSFKMHKLTTSKILANILNTLTPTKATFDGMNVSTWKADILKVNGFDERMQYGGEDRELGERLANNGSRFKQIRYSAICLHLEHERGYVTPEMIAKNNAIRKTTRKEQRVWTHYGIN